MSGDLLPSWWYAGRGVTTEVASVVIAYHQKCLCTLTGRRRRALAQNDSAWISAWLWRQNQTSPSSRKYQPLPTMPCALGGAPVTIEAWAVQVTAGTTPVIGAAKPRSARRWRFGVSAPRCAR